MGPAPTSLGSLAASFEQYATSDRSARRYDLRADNWRFCGLPWLSRSALWEPRPAKVERIAEPTVAIQRLAALALGADSVSCELTESFKTLMNCCTVAGKSASFLEIKNSSYLGSISSRR